MARPPKNSELWFDADRFRADVRAWCADRTAKSNSVRLGIEPRTLSNILHSKSIPMGPLLLHVCRRIGKKADSYYHKAK